MKADPIPCPCCSQPVSEPTVDMVIEHLRVPPLQARILGAIWKGKGHPIPTEASSQRWIEPRGPDLTTMKILK